ncbi:MAG: sigma-70 family RNA polymerase sigma factor [Alphaproteobacteria bacterium]
MLQKDEPEKDSSETDNSLLRRLQSHDHEAFSTLVERYTRMFFHAAYRVCSNQNDAEDIVQDAFLKLWRKPSMWDEGRGVKFTTWFYRVVTNLAIDYMRKKGKSQGSDVSERIKDETASQLEMLQMSEEQQLIESAIQNLPDRQRWALNLCFYEGLSNKEAAEIMDVKVKALESLLMRAKAGMRDELIRNGVLAPKDHKEKYHG